MDAFLLSQLAIYGPLALGLALFVAEVGLPIPIWLLVVASGGLGRQGLIDWPSTLIVGLVGVVLGDCTSYWLGRLAGAQLQRRVERWQPTAWQTAQARFQRHGALAVFLSRTVLTSLDVPMSLIAGASLYPFARFFLWDLAGRTIWIAAYGAIGYAVGSQWPAISEFIRQTSFWVGVLIAAVVILVLLMRRQGQNARSRIA